MIREPESLTVGQSLVIRKANDEMCIITIEDVVGIGPEPKAIRVSGTVVDCVNNIDGQGVIVSTSCQSEDDRTPFAPGEAANVDNGNWNIIIDVPEDAECGCGQPVFVKAWCAMDESCSAPDFTLAELRCPECPEVSFIAPEPEDIGCNPNSTASITLRATIINNTPTPIIAFIECGSNPDGVLDPPNSVNSIGVTSGDTQIVKATCRYPTPSVPKPFIRFTDFNNDNLGCPEIPLPVEPLGECPCPEVQDLTVTVNGCTATFEGEPSSAIEGCAFIWDFGDDSDNVETKTAKATHEYPCAKDYAAVVTLKCGELCSETTTIVVPIEAFEDCVCGACCLPDGSCKELTEEKCRSEDGVYKGDGSKCQDVECEGENGNGGNGGFDWPDLLCKSLLLLALLALIAASVFAFIAGCAGFATPPGAQSLAASGVAFASALALLGLWWWLCSDLDCKPLNDMIAFLTFLVMISAVLSLILIFFGNPCGWGSALGTGYIGVFLAIAVWIGKKTGCYGPLQRN